MDRLGLAHAHLDLEVWVVVPSWDVERVHPEDRGFVERLGGDIHGVREEVKILVGDRAGADRGHHWQDREARIMFASTRGVLHW
jgi:hypothetical protein